MFKVSHLFWLFLVVSIGILLNWLLSKKSTRKEAKPVTLPKIAPAEIPQPPPQPVAQKPEKLELPRFVFLELSKEDYMRTPHSGKVIIELFTEVVPNTCQNFIELCASKKYMGSPFHRVIKDFMVQGGDFINGNGTGSYSIYGANFPDENFHIKHTESGLLSMANSGPDTNGCQFFILTQPAPHLDNKHVVFGRVVSGMEHVSELENEVTDGQDKPVRKWFISDCGIVTQKSEGKEGEGNVKLVVNEELESWKNNQSTGGSRPSDRGVGGGDPEPFYGF